MAKDLESPALESSLGRVHRLVEDFVGASAADDAEDIVQESITRLLENLDRLSPSTWGPYAVITARNLLVSRERERDRASRHRHRLYDPEAPESPESQLLLKEEHADLTRALDGLPPADRDLLLQRYSGTDAISRHSLSAATAARHARVRARLRVAYLVQHGRVQLPTSRCRPVLEALTSGDRRRQERLAAARHLLACETCAAHSSGLIARRRASIGLHPLAWTGFSLAWVWRSAREHKPAMAVAVAAAAATVAGVVAVAPLEQPGGRSLAVGPSVAVNAAARGTVVIASVPVLPSRPPLPLPTGPAVGQAVPVVAVPADEGFWVGGAAGHRFWVQVVTGGESPVRVRPGDRVSFTGRALTVDAGFPARAGLTADEGATELAGMGVYVEVRPQDLDVTSS